jgi:hypothetical protein
MGKLATLQTIWARAAQGTPPQTFLKETTFGAFLFSMGCRASGLFARAVESLGSNISHNPRQIPSSPTAPPHPVFSFENMKLGRLFF